MHWMTAIVFVKIILWDSVVYGAKSGPNVLLIWKQIHSWKTKALIWKFNFKSKTWKIKPCIQTKNKCTNFDTILELFWINYSFSFFTFIYVSVPHFMFSDSKLFFFYGFKSFFSVSDLFFSFRSFFSVADFWPWFSRGGVASTQRGVELWVTA